MKPTCLALAFSALAAACMAGNAEKSAASRSLSVTPRTITLPAGPGPLQNPLKGWCTYTDAGPISQPYSMVYRYVSWKDLEPREGDYQFDAWEKKMWRDPLAAGRHVVFRVYMDYPSLPSGVPDWLTAKGVGAKSYSDYGGGRSPDYDNPKLVTGLERLIAALGKRYDHDPRVAFVQIGLLGYWGEWHTYPNNDLFAGPATQQRVVDAFHVAFPDKILMGRYPEGYLGRQPWLGYHDDMFPSDTAGPEDWQFLPKMQRSGRSSNWEAAAIGGEMEPHNADKWLGSGYADTIAAVKKAHMSWIGPYSPAIAPNKSPVFLAHSQELVRLMGYQFALRTLSCNPKTPQKGTLSLAVNGENEGVAPFYYPWTVKIVLMGADHHIAQETALKTDIRTWKPGQFHLHSDIQANVPPGRYTLGIGIIDPMTGKPAIQFANSMPVWNGWTTLTTIQIVK